MAVLPPARQVASVPGSSRRSPGRPVAKAPRTAREAVFLLAILLFTVAGPLGRASGQEQTQTVERKYSGMASVAINVGVFTSMKQNCTPAPLPVIRLLVEPAHGRVVVKRARLMATNFKKCLATDLPALVTYYRSVSDYVGEDGFTLEIIGEAGQVKTEHITVKVLRATAEGI